MCHKNGQSFLRWIKLFVMDGWSFLWQTYEAFCDGRRKLFVMDGQSFLWWTKLFVMDGQSFFNVLNLLSELVILRYWTPLYSFYKAWNRNRKSVNVTKFWRLALWWPKKGNFTENVTELCRSPHQDGRFGTLREKIGVGARSPQKRTKRTFLGTLGALNEKRH